MPTIAVATAAFLDFLKAGVSADRVHPGTLAYYQCFLGRHLVSIAPDVELGQLGIKHLFKGPNTHHFIRAVRRLLKYHHVPYPDDLVPPSPGRRQRIYSRTEFLRLRRAMKGNARLILSLIYYTGCRPQEARRLEWGRVFEHKRLIVLNQFKARSRRQDGVTLRYIPLPPLVARAFAKLRKRADFQPADYVFTNKFGKPFTCNALRCAVRRARGRAGLGPDVNGEFLSAYSGRHTFATNLVKGGLTDATELRDVLGHVDVSTSCHYLHRDGADLVAAIDRAAAKRRDRGRG